MTLAELYQMYSGRIEHLETIFRAISGETSPDDDWDYRPDPQEMMERINS